MRADLPLEKHTLTYDAKRRAWRRAGDESKLETLIAGDVAGPSSNKLVLAESVLANIEKFTASAVAYAEKKLRGIDAFRPQEWILEWAEFGIGEKTELEEFELFFVEQAPYVLWSVRFKNQGLGPHPCAVTRADW